MVKNTKTKRPEPPKTYEGDNQKLIVQHLKKNVYNIYYSYDKAVEGSSKVTCQVALEQNAWEN